MKGRSEKTLFFGGNASSEFVFLFMVFGIYAIVTQHFEMFFRDMYIESFNEIHSRDALLNGFVVFVPGIEKDNHFTI